MTCTGVAPTPATFEMVVVLTNPGFGYEKPNPRAAEVGVGAYGDRPGGPTAIFFATMRPCRRTARGMALGDLAVGVVVYICGCKTGLAGTEWPDISDKSLIARERLFG